MGQVHDWASAYDRAGKGWSKVVSYLKSGSPAALAQLAAMKDRDEYALRMLGAHLPALDALDDEGRRALHVLAATRTLSPVGDWLDQALAEGDPEQDIFGRVAAEVAPHGVGAKELFAWVSTVARDGQPTSAGRALLALSDDDLAWCLAHPEASNLGAMLEFLLDAAPDRMPPPHRPRAQTERTLGLGSPHAQGSRPLCGDPCPESRVG